ncbi:MAG: hypothetical protein ACRC1K_16970, partial [Planctomycetia bacterium]
MATSASWTSIVLSFRRSSTFGASMLTAAVLAMGGAALVRGADDAKPAEKPAAKAAEKASEKPAPTQADDKPRPEPKAEPAKPKSYTQTAEVMPTVTAGRPTPVAPKVKDDGPAPFWIWGADEGSDYRLRHTFTLKPGTYLKAVLEVTCDNKAAVKLNGKKATEVTDWKTPVKTDVAKLLKDGENTIVVDARNEDGPGGLVLRLTAKAADGAATVVLSDATWTTSVLPAVKPVDPEKRAKAKKAKRKDAADAGKPGDADSAVDEPKWEAVKVVAKYGDDPWKDAFAAAGPENSPFQTLEGYRVERLFTVPKEELGSWVSLTVDPKGRLLACDQNDRGLCLITPPEQTSGETKVERLPLKIGSAQGLLFAFDSLYLSVNGGPGSGLYRARDTDKDGELDKVEKLCELPGGGEHGPHALRLTPDGKSIAIVCGNYTDPPKNVVGSRIPMNWSEDLLLPRQWDAGGHAVGRLAPGGWIAKTDPDGKGWEFLSVGYRNTYDMAFNADGELFAYDSDMEWDFGSPWYRPTRVVHATDGSEFGWRSGTGCWPSYFLDSLPPAVD